MKIFKGNSHESRKSLLFFVAEDWYFALHFQQFAVAAVNDGWEVYLVCNTGQKGHEVVANIVAAGIKVVPLKLARSGITPWLDLMAFFKILALVKKIRPKMMHAVAVKPILICQLISRLTQTPLLAMITGLGHVFTGDSFKALVARPFVTSAMHSVAKNPLASFAVLNPEDAEWVKLNFKAKSTRIITVPGTGVDLIRFSPPACSPEMPFKIAYVGRMLRDKGIIELIEAVKILKSRNWDLQLLLAGAPDPSNPATLSSEQLSEWQSQGNCELLGHLQKIEDLYRRIHLLALPSYREGLGMTIVEAAASGVPAVAADVPGCRSAVNAGESGVLVPAKDPIALADAIETFLQNPDLRIKMGRAARRLAENRFSAGLVTAQVLAHYNTALEPSASVEC